MHDKKIPLILEELLESNSRIHKEKVLEKHRNNRNWMESLDFAYNPFIQFFIKKIPKYTSKESPDLYFEEALILLTDISSRSKTGNSAIEHLIDILSSLDPEEAKVIEKIIKKDLKVGVNIKTINKVYGDIIPEYPCMLTSSYSKKNLKSIKFPAYAQEKMDGMRVNIIVDNKKVSYRTRNGKYIELFGLFDDDFLALTNPNSRVVFDGEMLVERDGEILDRKTGNGILNKSIRNTITKDEAKQVRFILWDIIPLLNFKSKICKYTYSERFGTLVSAIEKASNVNRPYKVVDTRQVNNMQEANDLFNEFLIKGSEGIILKNADGIWENKRAKHQVKMKAELDADLKVISWVEGTGKYASKLGSLICESADGKLKVSVGSGFNDEQRDNLSAEDVVGKVITVKYNERINSKNKDEDSLFLPIFVEFREDKDTANTSAEIK